MKWNRTLSAAVVAAFALGASACDDGLAEINENPNAPTDVPAQYLLPMAIQTTVEQFYGQWFNLEFAGLFAQHWAKIQYIEEDLYNLRPATIDGWWTTLYAGSLKDWQTIIEKGQETGFSNHEATGRVMKAFTGHIMTDIWGDIPWSQALRGNDEEPVTTPAYDAQQDIYPALVAELDAALGLFDASERTWATEDLIYQGDVASWQRFANSLKLRLAMRVSEVDAAQAQAWVTQAVNSPAGLITQNSQNAALAFLESAPNQNPLYENWVGGRDDHAVSKTLVDLLASLNDPRLAIYAEPAAKDSVAMGGHVVYQGEVYRGMANGTPEEEIPPIATLSRIGEHWRSHTNTAAAATPAYLMTAAEVHFLLAEAELEWPGISGGMTAEQHYNAGVTAALQLYDGANGVDITAADISAYLAQPGVAWGTGDSNLELIIEQKWIALYANGPEAYAEYRRTGYPDEVTVREAHALAHVPGRVPYPDVEQSLNRANWEAATSAQGNDGTYTGKVWWDPAVN